MLIFKVFIDLFLAIVYNIITDNRRFFIMSKEALIIAILIALLILWITETLGMQKTSRLLAGGIDLGFAMLR